MSLQAIEPNAHPPPANTAAVPSPAGEIWSAKALCRTTAVPTEMYFSDDLADITAAKKVCAACPVMAECLEQAIALAEPAGVWGGQLFVDGVIVTHKRRRGRPPKVPRIEDQLLAVPIPSHLQRLIA